MSDEGDCIILSIQYLKYPAYLFLSYQYSRCHLNLKNLLDLGEVFLSQCSSQLYLSQNSFVTNIFFKSSNTMFATYCCHIFYVEKSPQSCTLQYCNLQLLGPTSLKKSSCPHPLVPCYNTPSTLLISNSIQSHPITSSSILSHLIPSNPL